MFVMDESTFWQLAKTLGQHPNYDDFCRLTARLAARPETDITGFADRLATMLWTLDTPAHFAAAQSPSSDVFLYIRCAVIAAGREAYDRVVREPAALEKFADEEAELLLTVAEEAYEQATGLLWEHDTPVSYETGSNATAWGKPAAAPASEASTPQPWLELLYSIGPGRPPAAYGLLLCEVVDAIAADPAWQRWWAAAGVPSCELSLSLDSSGFSPPTATVKKGRKRIQVHVTRDPGPLKADDPGALHARAAEEIRDMLDLARQRVGLGPMPPITALSSPAEMPAELFRPDRGEEPPPMIPAELHERALRGEILSQQDFIDYFRAHPDAEGAFLWLRPGSNNH